MTERDKCDVILTLLYNNRDSGVVYALMGLLSQAGLTVQNTELQRIQQRLMDDGYVERQEHSGQGMFRINSNGIDHVEEQFRLDAPMVTSFNDNSFNINFGSVTLDFTGDMLDKLREEIYSIQLRSVGLPMFQRYTVNLTGISISLSTGQVQHLKAVL
jgi:predicted transcriptional regulator